MLEFQSAPPHGGRLVQEHRDRTSGFNPRPRTGGDITPLTHTHELDRVSIRAPARGATLYADRIVRRDIQFQSAPPHGGDTSGHRRRGQSVFQSAPPHGGRQTGLPGRRRSGFNPRPRTGGDQRSVSTRTNSHHSFQSAPPHGGRQGQLDRQLGGSLVSIRAPARGATHIAARGMGVVREFQSAPPHGGRPASWRVHSDSCGPRSVSIRAPARGATRRDTAPHGGRDERTFQSAPPHGGRLGVRHRCMGPVHIRCFNPRPRTGGDGMRREYVTTSQVFQSAPPHGGRPEQASCRSFILGVSIRAPARGATCSGRIGLAGRTFQSAPPHGGRRGAVLERVSIRAHGGRHRAGDTTFQSAPPHGGRPRPATRR